ncbi:MAG TPA: hypothetical protein VMH00_03900 [Candidatus Limnocylindrales bacterium]|nr:hypothetical protein [Candidatus Limnocylindrales bacterium]
MATKTASKKTSKRTRSLKSAKKLESAKPLSTPVLYQACCSGKHYASVSLS